MIIRRDWSDSKNNGSSTCIPCMQRASVLSMEPNTVFQAPPRSIPDYRAISTP